ncbi:hypothetical protein [Fodinicurvata halophila]
MEVDPALGELRLEVPVEDVFLNGSTRLNGRAERLIDRIAAELAVREANEQDYDVELFNGFARQSMGHLLDSAGKDPVFMRAGALVRAFIDRDLPESKLSGGLLPGEEGQVRMVVRLWGGEGEPDDVPETRP